MKLPTNENPRVYSFGPFVLDEWERSLTRHGASAALLDMEMNVLRVLVRAKYHRVELSEQEMFAEIWPDQPPQNPDHWLRLEPRLKKQVSNVRNKLGRNEKGEQYVTGKPYRLLGEVKVGEGKVGEVKAELNGASVPPPEPRPLTPVPGGVNPNDPPYVGPQPFPTSHARLFFGRKSECGELVRLLQDLEKRVVLLYSPSGAGKTSLLHTALREALEKDGFQVLPVARVGVLPPSLEKSQNPYTFAAIASMAEDPVASLDAPVTWSQYLDSRVSSNGKGTILMVDQLEEIVTTEFGSRDTKPAFFRGLRDGLEKHPALRVILAFREDYFTALERLAIELESLWVRFPLPSLSRLDAAVAIAGPALTCGVEFEPEVVTGLVNALAQVRYVDALTGKEHIESGEFVDPPQLQMVCEALWRTLPSGKRRVFWPDIEHAAWPEHPQGQPVIQQDAIPQFVQSVIHGFWERAVQETAASQAFPPELIDLGCQQFVSERRIRLLAHQGQEYTGHLPNAIVEELERRHLLRVEERHGERFFELAHDTLIDPVCARAERWDAAGLQEFCLRSIRRVAGSERALAEGRPESLDEDVILRHCLSFVDDHGSALRVSAGSLDRGRTRLLPVELLSDSGLVRRTSVAGELFFELSNPRLSLAVHRMRQAQEHQARPFANAVRIVFACVVASISSLAVTMITRAFLAGFRLTLTQAPDAGFIAGWFQGVIGALVWSIFIAGWFAYWSFVVEDGHPERARSATLRASTSGALAGFFGAVFITIALLYAQRPDSLFGEGWIEANTRSPLTAFTETGLGFTMLLFGTVLGACSGFTAIRILLSAQWNVFLASQMKPASLAEMARVFAAVFGFTLKGSLLGFVPAMAAAVLLFYSLVPTPGVLRILGECFSITCGGVGIVAGLLFGLFLLRTGIAISAERE